MRDTSSDILSLLATYTFLSVSQFFTCWIVCSQKTMYRTLNDLADSQRLIWKKVFRYHPKYWKVENMYFLKPAWRKYLVQERWWDEKDIRMPLWSSIFYNDYQHRKGCINIHVALRNQFESRDYNIDVYDNYFEWVSKWSGPGRETATALHLEQWTIRADAICKISKGKEPIRLYCIELHMNFDVKRICQQLEKYVSVIAHGIASTKYKVEFDTKVLVVFENKSTMLTTIERLEPDPLFHYMKKHFLFKTLPNIQNNPIKDRMNLKREFQSLL